MLLLLLAQRAAWGLVPRHEQLPPCPATSTHTRPRLADPAWRERACGALAAAGVGLVSADELAHETVQRDREQAGLPPGARASSGCVCLCLLLLLLPAPPTHHHSPASHPPPTRLIVRAFRRGAHPPPRLTSSHRA